MLGRERRTRFGIIAEILGFCKKPQSKTRIMHKINMSWNTLEKYLMELQQAGLVEVHRSPIKHGITTKGQKFLKIWVNLDDLIQKEPSNCQVQFNNHNNMHAPKQVRLRERNETTSR
jgi:predicted transcriptional regulator